MRKSRFTEDQIIAILKEHEAGVPTAEVCRKHNISPASFYKYKAKFGGMEVSDARRLKALEDENAKLKKLLAEAMLDNAMLKGVASKKPSKSTSCVHAASLRRSFEPCGAVRCGHQSRPRVRARLCHGRTRRSERPTSPSGPISRKAL